ncbi:MAG: AI-2E family transporter [Flavobacteriales bacterium]|nr:AI-2E family transporter [Flavobacteriales bacterium]
MSLARTAYSLIIVIATVVILIYLKEILIPFILAVIIWFIIREVQTQTRKLHIGERRIPQWLSGVISFVLIFAVLGTVVNLLVVNIKGISTVLPTYEQNLSKVIDTIDSELGIDVLYQVREWSGSFDFTEIISIVINSITTLIGSAFLILIYVIFMMLEQRFFRLKFSSLYSEEKKRERANNILDEIDQSLSRYVALKTVVSLITGVASYIAMEIIGVDFAFFWAFLIFILNYIPNIGSLIATLFPTLIAAIQFGDLTPALYVLIAVGLIQVVVGNVLEPRLFGNSLNISSLVVILSLAFWGAIWGVVGMILSVPITVMLILTFAQFDETRGISILLSDKGMLDRD